jgi:hypothetical protein
MCQTSSLRVLQRNLSSESIGVEPKDAARFSLESYLLREAMLVAKFRSQQNASPPKIPAGFPQQINLPSVWKSSTLNIGEITHRVTPGDIEELEMALQEFNGK